MFPLCPNTVISHEPPKASPRGARKADVLTQRRQRQEKEEDRDVCDMNLHSSKQRLNDAAKITDITSDE